MAQEINFPLSTPQIQAAERVQSQLQHSPANVQHSLAGDAVKDRQLRSETVNEASESENPNVDQEGHLGAEREASEREEKDFSGEEEESAQNIAFPGDTYLQGRFINVVI